MRERPPPATAARENLVFYAKCYHPIQAGSIDGTDTAPHDNAVYRAHLCSSIGLYDPFGDPKAIGDPYCTVFVGRIARHTTEETLHKAMSQYGRVKNLRLVQHIVTGASRGYAFVEYETEKDMRRAYEKAHHSLIDGSEIIVDFNRQQLMPGWIPRRLGGGLGGKKESGQLRFGGRERPFRAPLRPIPWDDLKRLGITPPPEGRYMTRYQVPSPPRRPDQQKGREDSTMSQRSEERDDSPSARKRKSADREGSLHTSSRWTQRSTDKEASSRKHRRHREGSYTDDDKEASLRKHRRHREDLYTDDDKEASSRKYRRHREDSYTDDEDKEPYSTRKMSTGRDDSSYKHNKHGGHSHSKRKRSRSRD